MRRKKPVASPTDYRNKEDDAEDYFDINELADEPIVDSKEDYDIEDAIPAAKLSADKIDDASKIKSDSGNVTDDKELMPPPPLESAPSAPKLEENAETSPTDSKKIFDKRLDTPLGAMLPQKYADVDVTDLFPDFRQDKVLRFSRLFGPGKFSSLPQIWRSVRRKAKKKRKEREKLATSESNTSDSDESRKCNGFNLKYAPTPPKEMCASDDEDKLLSEKTNEEKEQKQEDNNNSDQKSKAAADWRFGPAQIWYDMLDVPESGENFNYGFKMKDKKENDADEIEEKPVISHEYEDEDSSHEIPDDAFLMVSQLHWEDDVVWDGSLIKDKVEQKLNSKTNAAGWLPSSGSRTAAFSQPGKSNLPSTSSSISDKKMPILSKYGKAQQTKQQQEEADDTWYSIFPVENEELVYSKWEDEVIWDAEGEFYEYL
jgi:transcription initiation factor TFIID subunit 1